MQRSTEIFASLLTQLCESSTGVDFVYEKRLDHNCHTSILMIADTFAQHLLQKTCEGSLSISLAALRGIGRNYD